MDCIKLSLSNDKHQIQLQGMEIYEDIVLFLMEKKGANVGDLYMNGNIVDTSLPIDRKVKELSYVELNNNASTTVAITYMNCRSFQDPEQDTYSSFTVPYVKEGNKTARIIDVYRRFIVKLRRSKSLTSPDDCTLIFCGSKQDRFNTLAPDSFHHQGFGTFRRGTELEFQMMVKPGPNTALYILETGIPGDKVRSIYFDGEPSRSLLGIRNISVTGNCIKVLPFKIRVTLNEEVEIEAESVETIHISDLISQLFPGKKLPFNIIAETSTGEIITMSTGNYLNHKITNISINIK